MKLYFSRRTRATRVRWLLEELGVPYELVSVDMAAGQHKTPEHLALHPLGLVPVLVDDASKSPAGADGTPLFESVGICMYLADKFAERGYAPAQGTTDRGLYYQWMAFGAATFEPAIVAAGSKTPDAGARAAFDAAAAVLDQALTNKDFLVGGRMTAADVVIGALAIWAGSMKLLGDHPVLDGYAKTLKGRPAWAKGQG